MVPTTSPPNRTTVSRAEEMHGSGGERRGTDCKTGRKVKTQSVRRKKHSFRPQAQGRGFGGASEPQAGSPIPPSYVGIGPGLCIKRAAPLLFSDPLPLPCPPSPLLLPSLSPTLQLKVKRPSKRPPASQLDEKKELMFSVCRRGTVDGAPCPARSEQSRGQRQH